MNVFIYQTGLKSGQKSPTSAINYFDEFN